MRLSLYSAVAFKNPFGLARAFGIASSLGYGAVEVRGHSLDTPCIEARNVNAVGYDMIGPNTLDGSGAGDLLQNLRSANLAFSGISCYNPLTLPDGELAGQCIGKFREMIDFAVAMSIPWVRMIGFSEAPIKGVSLPLAEAKRLFVRRMKMLCRYGMGKKVGLLLENGENSIPGSSTETLELADAIAESNLGIVFDAYNAVFEGLDPLAELKILRGRVTCLHVKNARIRSPAADDYSPKGDRGFRWTLLTDGDIDYRVIMEEAVSHGFDGEIVCEYANPYKGMSRKFWERIPDPWTWAEDAHEFLSPYMR
ncbi:MAG: sugar phosphate isomerase/epimerase [Planctomycetota bacterium]|nr:sugar phosphate isomerase/epimerase [Planctomycetota bacterium]